MLKIEGDVTNRSHQEGVEAMRFNATEARYIGDALRLLAHGCAERTRILKLAHRFEHLPRASEAEAYPLTVALRRSGMGCLHPRDHRVEANGTCHTCANEL